MLQVARRIAPCYRAFSYCHYYIYRMAPKMNSLIQYNSFNIQLTVLDNIYLLTLRTKLYFMFNCSNKLSCSTTDESEFVRCKFEVLRRARSITGACFCRNKHELFVWYNFFTTWQISEVSKFLSHIFLHPHNFVTTRQTWFCLRVGQLYTYLKKLIEKSD